MVFEEEREKIIAELPEEATTKITTFYGVLNKLIGNRNLLDCVAAFGDDLYEREISANGTKLSFTYPLGGQQQIDLLLIPTPNKDISMIGHEIINRLSVRLSQSSRTNLITQDALDQLSRCVPNIQILIITRGVPAYILGHNQQTITQDLPRMPMLFGH